MCQLFVYTSKRRRGLNATLREFYLRSDFHPDGWGLALFDGGDAFMAKGPEMASRSAELAAILQEGVSGANVMAHIRYATVGFNERENCHPFAQRDKTGRQWTLMHNGTVFEDSILKPYEQAQRGSTDSERILCLLVERINKATALKGQPLSAKERFEEVSSLFREISPGNKINIVVHDGEGFYVHTNCVGQLHYVKAWGGFLICTRPLKRPEGARWRQFPVARTMVFRDGERIYASEPHPHILTPQEESAQYMRRYYA